MADVDLVVISGVPHAGHRLIKRLMVHLGFDEGDVRIVHHAPPLFWEEELPRYERERVRLILPLRDPENHARSLAHRNPNGHEPLEEMHARQWFPTLWAAAKIPAMAVRYEDIIEDSYATGRALAHFVGKEWAGWPETIYDGNAVYKNTEPATPRPARPQRNTGYLTEVRT